MQVQVGHFRQHGAGEPPHGSITETLGITVVDDESKDLLTLIIDPEPGGCLVQIDKGAVDHPDGGKLTALDTSHEGVVLLRVSRTDGGGDGHGGQLIELRPRS